MHNRVELDPGGGTGGGAVLHDNEFAAGCPVLAATLESDELPGAREAARETFRRFQDLHFELLRRVGVPEERARSLAVIALSAVEGAIVLSRAERSTAPLDQVLDELEILFTGAVGDIAPNTFQGAAS